MTALRSQLPELRPFEPGTTGWSADDLNDPEIEKLWESGHYEIVEGVLTTMAAAYFQGGSALYRVIRQFDSFRDAHGIKGDFGFEADLIVSARRVARVDAAFLTPDDMERQRLANLNHPRWGRKKLKYGRLLVPPTLIIESISLGHESHDRETKRGWFAEFGVPHYWIVDSFEHTLDCLTLREGKYEIDQSGRENDVLKPTLFTGLEIQLAKLWL
ncbi:MAG: Uma2 family endonuclease [Phycisphaeraceae bacterium]